jgi:hypothetical protein
MSKAGAVWDMGKSEVAVHARLPQPQNNSFQPGQEALRRSTSTKGSP